jgi:hypothetical protein
VLICSIMFSDNILIFMLLNCIHILDLRLVFKKIISLCIEASKSLWTLNGIFWLQFSFMQYLEELLGSLLFCWVACGVSLAALVEVICSLYSLPSLEWDLLQGNTLVLLLVLLYKACRLQRQSVLLIYRASTSCGWYFIFHFEFDKN